MATMVVGPLLSIVQEKLSNYLLVQYKVMEGMEEQHKILKRKLPAILDVITDAEQAASHREGAKAWLEEVKTVAYEANEIFDKFKYEALRRQAKKNGHYSKLGFDVVKLFPTQNCLLFRHKMGKKLCRIVQAIEVLVAEMNSFGFKYQQQAPASKQLRQTDHVIFDPKKIISRSRYQDTRNIVDTLLGHVGNETPMVIPIVGVGGLGKTTLAQLIYNDTEIKKHFEVLLWVCVSDSFDENSLAKSIVELHPKVNRDEEASNRGPLDILQDVLRRHRYLLVLDDMWNREPDKWERLKSCFIHGAKGSAVLATTRDEEVAKILATVKAYNLAPLEDKFVKEIIETRAFSFQKEDERPSVLVNMVGDIAKRCRGSPLAATALGSLLRTKTSEQEWKAISNRSNICTEESGILPILKLSYNDLSPQMKQCFSFCAVFPKDYEIDINKMIQLWIAHGFIQEQKEVSPETIGKRIFSDLASRSFFQDVKQEKMLSNNKPKVWGSYSKHTCKIHDLMHDVALSTMEKECAHAPEEANQIEWLPDTARHLLLSCEKPEIILNDSLARRSLAIQTLLCDSYMKHPLERLSKYGSLKVLRLCIDIRSFPLKSKHLHHLRYLDLSGSSVEALPEDISTLYNLQILNISDCCNLHRLPRQMKYMTALRHLYTRGCLRMRSMPGDLRKLISLETLTYFVAGPMGSECSGVGELQHLNLGGLLELNQLENVTEEDAKTANLRNKKELRELTLKWTGGRCMDDARVLEGLKPHDGLHAVRIESYGGTTFPTWMAAPQNMVEINLSYCKKLQWLLSRGICFTFPKLKEFMLRGLDNLETWWEISYVEQGEEIKFPQLEKLFIIGCGKLTALPEATLLGESYGTMARSAFPALKVLCLDALDSFHKWDAVEGTQKGHIIFPNLEELTIEDCPVLRSLPEAPFGGDSMTRSAFPALKVLKLKHLRSFERWNAVKGSQGDEIMFPQLEKLHVIGCGEQKVCPELTTEAKSPNLSVLDLQGSEEEMFLWVARHMASLTNLKLQNCEKTETTSMLADSSLSQLVGVMQKRNHHDFPLEDMELVGLKSSVTELCACFVQLQHLYINDCAALVHWPEKEFQSLVSLKRLAISNCKQLVGYAQSPAADPSTELASSSQLLPHLESLWIFGCKSMVEIFNAPASLREMKIWDCAKLKSIFSSRLHQGQSAFPNLQGRSLYSEVSSSSAIVRADHFPYPCLECVSILGCESLTGVLYLPPSVKSIVLYSCNALRSVESHSGEMPFLEYLYIVKCKTLSSLPNGPQAYLSLRKLEIKHCPGMKRLPTSLQERLSSLESESLDACYQGPILLKPKTWKYAIRRD